MLKGLAPLAKPNTVGCIVIQRLSGGALASAANTTSE